MVHKYLLSTLAVVAMAYASPMAQEVSHDWTAVIDIAEGATSCEDGQLIPTSDGNCVGIYTTGGQGDIYAGRIVKMDMQGNTLWQQPIQAITSTTAQRVAEGPNGCYYVTGTTLDGASTTPYIAKFTAEGQLDQTIIIDAGADRCMIGDFTALADGLVFFASTRSDVTYTGKYVYRYYDYDLTEQAASDYAPSGSISVPVNVVTNEVATIAVIENGAYVEGKLYIFATGSSEAPKLRNGGYSSGAADDEDFYFAFKGTDGYWVERCSYSDGYLNTKWASETVDFSTNYYTTVVKPCQDGNVYLWHKSNSSHRVAKFSGETGAVDWCQSIVPGLGQTSIGDGFAYTLGVAENGDFVAGGHSGDFKVFWYRLAAETGEYVSSMVDIVNDRYAYAYTFDEMSSFAEDTFYFSGYMRDGNGSNANIPFFATYDIEDPSQHLWCSMPECGYVPCDYPGTGVIAEDGCSYIALTISSQPALGKYDAKGELLWSSKCGDDLQGQGRFVHINADGSIALVSAGQTASYYEYPTVVSSFTANGELVAANILPTDSYFATQLCASWLEGDEVMVISSGYDNMWNRAIIIEKVAFDGTNASVFVPITSNLTPYDAKIDQNGAILVFGYNYDSNYSLHPCIAKIKADGTIVYETAIATAMDGEFFDAWSDSEGRTYAVGMVDNAYAYYALLDAEGELMDEQKTDCLGYFETVSGVDDDPILVGTLTPAGTTTIVGRVMRLSSGTVDALWSTDLSSSIYTYALELSVAEDALVVAGYETDGSTVAEMVAAISKEGELLSKSVTESIPNVNDDYFISNLSTAGDKALVLSARSVANSIYVGYASMYTIQKGWDKVQSIESNLSVPMAIEYFDLQGRPLGQDYRGLCIKREVMSDGSTRTLKVVK